MKTLFQLAFEKVAKSDLSPRRLPLELRAKVNRYRLSTLPIDRMIHDLKNYRVYLQPEDDIGIIYPDIELICKRSVLGRCPVICPSPISDEYNIGFAFCHQKEGTVLSICEVRINTWMRIGTWMGVTTLLSKGTIRQLQTLLLPLIRPYSSIIETRAHPNCFVDSLETYNFWIHVRSCRPKYGATLWRKHFV